MRQKKSLIATLAFVATTTVCAQTASKVHVYVDNSAEDGQGSRLIYAVKEQIRKSASMQLSDTEKDSLFQLRVSTLDPDHTNVRTIYSVVVTLSDLKDPGWFSSYLDSTVGACGSQVIDQCANAMVARLDQNISQVRAGFAAAKK